MNISSTKGHSALTEELHLTEELKNQFAKEGCCLVNGVLLPDQVTKLRDLVITMAKREEELGNGYVYSFDKSGKTKRVWNLTNKDQNFRDLIEFPIVDEVMNYVFDRETKHQKYYLSSFQATVVEPGSNRQRLHIDTPFPEPLPPWPIKANSIWLLDDFTDSNGATEYVKGSHLLPYKPTENDDENILVERALGKSGSVFFTHGNLWHRAGQNCSDTPRVALLLSFAASYAREISSEEDNAMIISDRVKEAASEHLKTVLGVGHGIKEGALIEHEQH